MPNEYTTPLVGKPYFRNVGVIKVYDKHNRFYSVGEIIYERFDDQNYQYIIVPYWKLIKYLPNGVFHGIPGINMDLEAKEYYRVNMTPAFISMRTPSESREDVLELMSSVGLDYYDRFEWLLRSESLCGDDNLFVVRKIINQENEVLDLAKKQYWHPDNTVVIDKISDIQSSNSSVIDDLYGLLQSGVKIFIKSESSFIDDEKREVMLNLLKNVSEIINKNNQRKRNGGIEKAKKLGKYKGRKPIFIDKDLLNSVAKAFINKEISEEIAMERLSLKSRATFYRKIKEYKNSLL